MSPSPLSFLIHSHRRVPTYSVDYQLTSNATLQGGTADFAPPVSNSCQYTLVTLPERPWSTTGSGSSGGVVNDASSGEFHGAQDYRQRSGYDMESGPMKSTIYAHHQISSSGSFTAQMHILRSSSSDRDELEEEDYNSSSSNASSITVMKTHAFGALRRSRRTQKPPVDANRYKAAMGLIEGYSQSTDADDISPSQKRARMDFDEPYSRSDSFSQRIS